jgi:hypothetical protein
VRRLGALLAAPARAPRTRAVAARFTPQTGVDRMCAALDDLAR